MKHFNTIIKTLGGAVVCVALAAGTAGAVVVHNTPPINGTEAQYEQMWAQDVAAMGGYHAGASTALTGASADLQTALTAVVGLNKTASVDAVVKLESALNKLDMAADRSKSTLAKLQSSVTSFDHKVGASANSQVRADVAQVKSDTSRLAVNFNDLLTVINQATAQARAALNAIRSREQNVTAADADRVSGQIADHFDKMRVLMNRLSQLDEMSTNIMSAMNSAINSMARSIKQ